MQRLDDVERHAKRHAQTHARHRLGSDDREAQILLRGSGVENWNEYARVDACNLAEMGEDRDAGVKT